LANINPPKNREEFALLEAQYADRGFNVAPFAVQTPRTKSPVQTLDELGVKNLIVVPESDDSALTAAQVVSIILGAE
jgi:hypothetical protein